MSSLLVLQSLGYVHAPRSNCSPSLAPAEDTSSGQLLDMGKEQAGLKVHADLAQFHSGGV